MKIFILIAGMLLTTSTAFANAHVCADQVPAQAAKLFNLHYGPTTEIVAYTPVVQKQSLRSPDNRRNYDVLETTAMVGKMGQFRIRMIYAVLEGHDSKPYCLLMGQEVFDLSSL